MKNSVDNIVALNEYEDSCTFQKLKNLKDLVNKKGDTIPFLLTYKKDTCYFSEDIKFYRIYIMLKSKDYLFFNFGIGYKKDSLFTSFLYNEKPYVEDIQFFLSFRENNYPKELDMIRAFFPRNLSIDTIYHKDNEKIFRVDSFYNMPHDQIPKYTFDKLYLSKKRGIFRVDVTNNETNEICQVS